MTETVYENCNCCSGTTGISNDCCNNIPTTLYATFTNYSCLPSSIELTYNSSFNRWESANYDCSGQTFSMFIECFFGMISVSTTCNAFIDLTSGTASCEPFYFTGTIYPTSSCPDGSPVDVTITE